jgi:hypothetical protein
MLWDDPLIALHILFLFLNSLNNESPARTKRTLLTVTSPKCFFFLSKIFVILYEAIVVPLALLMGLRFRKYCLTLS